MSNDTQSQQVLVQPFNWEPLFDLPPIDIARQIQGVIVGRTLGGYVQTQPAVYACKFMDFVQGSTAYAGVATNGSVKRNGAGIVHAAENVADWKVYLPEDCVRAMMNAGWHWST